jgi:uncharacterized membrane protein
MEPHYPAGSGTVAAIGRHPLHPLLVPLPIGFLVGALVADIAFAASADAFWARGAFWLLIGGVVTGLLAGLAGIIELLGVQRARSMTSAWIHGLGNIVALVLAVVNIALRWSDHVGPADSTGLVLSLLVVAILAVTGWIGGELSYRHGVGVSDNIGRNSSDSTDRKFNA